MSSVWSSLDVIMEGPRGEVRDHTLHATNFNEVYPLYPWARRERRLTIFSTYPPRHVLRYPVQGHPVLLYQSDRPFSWDSIQVVGFHVDTAFGYHQGIRELYKCAREVFRSQPTRLFVHGYFVDGSSLERWVFDRSGMYCSGSTPFDPKSIWPGTIMNQLIVDVVKNYQLMSDIELGVNPSVRYDRMGNYIPAHGYYPQPRLYLERTPLVHPRKIVSRRTICYRARTLGSEYEYAVKFSWRSRSRSPEERMLRLAQQRNVQGVVRLVSYHVVDESANLRQYLELVGHRGFPHADPVASPSTNLDMSCLVVTPSGRPISKFDDIRELLEAFRDAIKAHRSLYFDGGILHRDISTGNIIIPDTKKEGEPRGMLIDLDLSKEVADLPTTSEQVVGTRPFMSIDLMKHGQHSCLHDLDSFFFVFLWVVICRDDEPSPESVLNGWSDGSFDQIVRRKAKDISLDNFHILVSEFPPFFRCLAGLAYELREMVDAPWKYISRPRKTQQIERQYFKMISAFEAALDDYMSGRLGGELEEDWPGS
ncbi:hypothetical protein CDV31_012226 [Fusarium ambrosium]|uniref:EKC/KEOPS complex subunit BUD32 n=1 Tax=Fusarium ambrosium TaxID=131363 RepID=A0A428TBF4_9HYPO|nr:hypothetical protein CDV31_012226 [Fusarium ambrosium]